MQYIKDQLKYHGYNYGVYCQEMAQKNGIIPHIDLSAAAVQLFLNIPILIIKTKYIHNPTSNKKEWFCTAHEALGTTRDLDIHSYKIIIVDNNNGFVGATAPIPITHLKEDMISMIDNLKYSIESVHSVGSSPQGNPILQINHKGFKLFDCSTAAVLQHKHYNRHSRYSTL